MPVVSVIVIVILVSGVVSGDLVSRSLVVVSRDPVVLGSLLVVTRSLLVGSESLVVVS